MAIDAEEDYFVREYVLLAGLIGGACSVIGVDPDPASIGIIIIKTLNAIFPTFFATICIIILTVVGLLTTAYTWYSAYNKGKILGLLAVVLAWSAGVIIIKYPTDYAQFGAYLAFASMLLGIFAIRLKRYLSRISSPNGRRPGRL
jgi:hypothetical protein